MPAAFTPNIDTKGHERRTTALPTDKTRSVPETQKEQLKVLHADIRKIVEELRQVSHAFNRRLDFEMNDQLGEVIVRIVNSDTGEVIKVLPPEELQKLHLKIKETVGLLVDEKI